MLIVRLRNEHLVDVNTYGDAAVSWLGSIVAGNKTGEGCRRRHLLLVRDDGKASAAVGTENKH